MDVTFKELWEEFRQLDLHDDRRLIDWLSRVFATGWEQDEEIPYRDEVAIQIGRTRRLLPNPQLGLHSGPGRQAETEWTLVSCINALITHPSATSLKELYSYTASITEIWLMGS